MNAHERISTHQPMHELATEIAAAIGETPEQRIDWLLGQDTDSFSDLLIHINATARTLIPEHHGFDGEGVQAGAVAGSIPPDQEDKVVILNELLQNSQQVAKSSLAQGETAQTVMHEASMAIPVIVNKLHLFSDGNGRTSRFLRMVLRDSDQLTPEKTEMLISKNGTDRYATTPAIPVERAVMPAIRKENGTDKLTLLEDVFDGGEDSVVETEIEDLYEKYPRISAEIIESYEDRFNFSESMRLLAKNNGAKDEISLRAMFEAMVNNPEQQQHFLQNYKEVRKQRVELLMKGLLGLKEVPLIETDREEDVKRWINATRKRKGQSELDSASIYSIQDFQMAYMETFSPDRQ